MSELIKKLERALDEMSKTGNNIGIDLLENALRDAKFIAATPPYRPS